MSARTLARITVATGVATAGILVPLRLQRAPQTAALPTPAVSSAPTSFALTLTEPLENYQTIGVGINEKGDIAGIALSDNDEVRAFAFRGRKGELLPLPPQARLSVATGINDKGEVVGIAGTEETVRGTVWSGSRVGVLTRGSADTIAFTLSRDTVAAGFAMKSQRTASIWALGLSVLDPFEASSSFHHQLTTIQAAGDFSGMLWSKPGDGKPIGEFLPRGGNAAGTIVGNTFGKNGPVPAVYKNGKTGVLPTPSGYEFAVPLGIAPSETIVGAGIDGDDKTRPVAWARGKSVALPVPGNRQGIALGVNGKDQAVGVIEAENGEGHAALWTKGDVIDLDQAVEGRDGWKLLQARGINESGAIIGTGIKDGKVQAFVLKIK